jgi:hypothetical protein
VVSGVSGAETKTLLGLEIRMGFDSVQPEFALDKPKLLRRDEAPMRDTYAVERPIKIRSPVIEEIDELRKIRGNIVVLPDVALEQPREVRQAIKDFRRGEGKALELAQ